jgi:heme-degrading monooxygenase HmoA
MADRSSGRLVAVSYWESESDMQASEDATRESREAAAEVAGASGGPRVERYEVLLDLEQ